MNASLWGRRLLKAAVALGITGYLLWVSDPAAVLAAVRRADWRWIAVALLLVLADRALNAWRWIALLDNDGAGSRLPTSRLLHIFFVSTFLGTFLPASGDLLVRAWQLSREQTGRVRAVASVVMDRLLGVVGLVIVVAGGLVIGRHLVDPRTVNVALAVSVLACVAAVALLYSPHMEALLHAVAARLPAKLSSASSTLLRAIRAYSTRHAAITGVLLASIAVNVIRVLQAWAIGRSLGIEAGLAVYFGLVPVINLLIMLPISVAGLGVSQAGFVGFFGLVGVPAAEAFALSVLYVGLSVVGNLPGAFLYLLGKERAPAPSGATSDAAGIRRD